MALAILRAVLRVAPAFLFAYDLLLLASQGLHHRLQAGPRREQQHREPHRRDQPRSSYHV